MKSSVDETDAKKTKAADTVGTDSIEEDGSKGELMETFSFPHFGKSPGPTPRSTPDGTPVVMSEAEESEAEVCDERVEGKGSLFQENFFSLFQPFQYMQLIPST